MTTSNNTNINWGTDSLNVICAKQELAKFLQEQTELKGKSSKIDAYHEKRISELNAFINVQIRYSKLSNTLLREIKKRV